MAEILTTTVVLICMAIILAGVLAAYVLKLLPHQWKCMYEDNGEDKCERQCLMCRNFENNGDYPCK